MTSAPHGTPEWADERSAARARRNRRLIRYVGLFFVLVSLALALLLQRQQMTMQAFIQDQCHQRVANVTKANANWDALAAIERHNRFIDDDLRRQRLDMYEHAHLTPPTC